VFCCSIPLQLSETLDIPPVFLQLVSLKKRWIDNTTALRKLEAEAIIIVVVVVVVVVVVQKIVVKRTPPQQSQTVMIVRSVTWKNFIELHFNGENSPTKFGWVNVPGLQPSSSVKHQPQHVQTFLDKDSSKKIGEHNSGKGGKFGGTLTKKNVPYTRTGTWHNLASLGTIITNKQIYYYF
jgi:hypothetical protein